MVFYVIRTKKRELEKWQRRTQNSEALEDNYIEKWRTKSRRSKLDRQTGTINELQERKYPESKENPVQRES